MERKKAQYREQSGKAHLGIKFGGVPYKFIPESEKDSEAIERIGVDLEANSNRDYEYARDQLYGSIINCGLADKIRKGFNKVANRKQNGLIASLITTAGGMGAMYHLSGTDSLDPRIITTIGILGLANAMRDVRRYYVVESAKKEVNTRLS